MAKRHSSQFGGCLRVTVFMSCDVCAVTPHIIIIIIIIIIIMSVTCDASESCGPVIQQQRGVVVAMCAMMMRCARD